MDPPLPVAARVPRTRSAAALPSPPAASAPHLPDALNARVLRSIQPEQGESHPVHPVPTRDNHRLDILQSAAAHVRDQPPAHPRPSTSPGTPAAVQPASPGVRETDAGSPAGRGGKERSTPDAKRAQNRASAKRFRVAQKKRWEELQETVRAKDDEIERLKAMLQKVTETRLPAEAPLPPTPTPPAAGPVAVDKLVMSELDLFVKLVSTPGRHAPADGGSTFLPSPASNIGCLHRVLVAGTDGAIAGVRHMRSVAGAQAVGGVGSYVWDDVHASDSLQLRFTVLHASRMAADMAREALVFAYRRRVVGGETKMEDKKEGEVDEKEAKPVDERTYVRMKGCVHPVLTASGAVTHLIIAEFLET